VNWLSNILNGVWGQVELILNLTKVDDVISSESMEAFFYRIDLLQPPKMCQWWPQTQTGESIQYVEMDVSGNMFYWTMCLL
jgi:hypothetical protein